MTTPKEIPFTDSYGDERVIRKRVSGGFSVKRDAVTPILAINREVSCLVGKRIHALRVERGLTLVELATRIGAGTGNPKQRMWQIENPGVRETGETYGGMRLGTLYALAIALGVEVIDLLPAVSEVRVAALADQPVVAGR
jgi:hypothetical protein